ncbi:hypothetical protein K504DRAFT_449117 [Pleomassaria siparia CBS 279.74]|uniref:F-box domain-containing protein n=1 Tax=Pleomassaria siparia CBS 279.74 TaxID=1314801 RepID=A0A6G1JWS8_9PLEO|nr:hypothetical protein K504DRAFT_449117 [Pleomassaria siparia CBS 279.74]
MATMTLDRTVTMPTQTIAAEKEDNKETKTMTATGPLPKIEERGAAPSASVQEHVLPSMMGISHELRREICEHLSRKDLINVCLTNKVMQDAAVRSLYRNISLKVAGYKTKALDRIAAMLSRENPGIDHIQSVHLLDWCQPTTSCAHPEDSALAATRYLMNALPKDKLKSFLWDSPHNFTVELSLLLLKRQRNMKHIELHITVHDPEPCINDAYQADLSILKSVEKAESLHFEPRCHDCLDYARTVLDRAKSVKKLKLSGYYISDRRVTMNDEGAYNDVVFSRLFGHLKEPGTPSLRLTSLSLSGIDLTECKVNYANVLHFETLKKLRILNCWRPDLFLDCSMYPNQGRAIRLEDFILQNHECNDERLVNSTLDRFLKHNKGLKNLQLYLQNDGSLPTLENIIWHGDTLEKLFVCVRKDPHDPNGDHVSYTTPDQLAQLCAAMPKLKQLALSLDDWPVSMDCKLHKDKDGFKEKILASSSHSRSNNPLAKLPKLQTLNIIKWPQIGCGCACLDMREKTFRVLMRAQATEFFRLFKEAQALAHPETKADTLRVMAFGEHEDFGNQLSGMNEEDQVDFLRRDIFYRMQGRETWTDKEDSPLAVTIEPEHLESVEVDADILNNWFKFRPSWGAADMW